MSHRADPAEALRCSADNSVFSRVVYLTHILAFAVPENGADAVFLLLQLRIVNKTFLDAIQHYLSSTWAQIVLDIGPEFRKLNMSSESYGSVRRLIRTLCTFSPSYSNHGGRYDGSSNEQRMMQFAPRLLWLVESLVVRASEYSDEAATWARKQLGAPALSAAASNANGIVPRLSLLLHPALKWTAEAQIRGSRYSAAANNGREDDSNQIKVGGPLEDALVAACSVSNVTAVKMILEAGADPNLPGYELGICYPTRAAVSGRKIAKHAIQVLKLLMEHGADLTLPKGHSFLLTTALMYNNPDLAAEDNKYNSLILFLLNDLPPGVIERGGLLRDSISKVTMMYSLLERSASSSRNATTTTTKTVTEVNKTFRLLLDNGFPPCGEAFVLACQQGREQLVKLLLSYGADPNFHFKCGDRVRQQWTYSRPLAAAIRHPRIVRILLEHGASTTFDPSEMVASAVGRRLASAKELAEFLKLDETLAVLEKF